MKYGKSWEYCSMKCRNCGGNDRVKSPLKGVCRFCFPTMTPRTYEMLSREAKDIPRKWLRGIQDARPPITEEMARKEREWRANPVSTPELVEVELDVEGMKLLEQVRFKRAKEGIIKGPHNEESIVVSSPEPPMVEVEVSPEDMKLLEIARMNVRFGIRSKKDDWGRFPKPSKGGKRGR